MKGIIVILVLTVLFASIPSIVFIGMTRIPLHGRIGGFGLTCGGTVIVN